MAIPSVRADDVTQATRAFADAQSALWLWRAVCLFGLVTLVVNTLALLPIFGFSLRGGIAAWLILVGAPAAFVLGILPLGYWAIATLRPGTVRFVGLAYFVYVVGMYVLISFLQTAGNSPFTPGGALYGMRAWGLLAVLTLLSGGTALRLWSAAGSANRLRENHSAARLMPEGATYGGIWASVFQVWPKLARRFSLTGNGTALFYLSMLIYTFSVGYYFLSLLLVVATIVAPLFVLLSGNFSASLMTAVSCAIGAVVAHALAIGFVLLGEWIRNGARWQARAGFAERIGRDNRKPILFLRSFTDDQVRIPGTKWLRRVALGELGRRRLDHILVEDYSAHGPVVAIGRPGDADLPFGAARLYVPDDQWQDAVKRLADAAAHIVIVADETAGVQWEVETLLAHHRRKTLFLASPKQSSVFNSPALKAWSEHLPSHARNVDALALYLEPTGAEVLVVHHDRLSPAAFQVTLNAFFRRGGAEADLDTDAPDWTAGVRPFLQNQSHTATTRPQERPQKPPARGLRGAISRFAMRLVGLLFRPGQTWRAIAQERPTWTNILTNHLLPLAILTSACMAIQGSFAILLGLIAWIVPLLVGTCLVALLGPRARAMEGAIDRTIPRSAIAFPVMAYAITPYALLSIMGVTYSLWSEGFSHLAIAGGGIYLAPVGGLWWLLLLRGGLIAHLNNRRVSWHVLWLSALGLLVSIPMIGIIFSMLGAT